MNLLDKINITPKAYNEYVEFATEIQDILKAENVKPSDVPDENARELYNGDLEIYLFIKNKKYSFIISRDDWAWA